MENSKEKINEKQKETITYEEAFAKLKTFIIKSKQEDKEADKEKNK